MALVRWNANPELSPWSALRDLENQFNQFFGDTSGGRTGGQSWVPAVDVHEEDDAYVVEADIPGLKKEDIHLEVIENTLTIKGERKSERETKKDGFRRVERSYGSFQRSVEVPGGFDAENVSAKFEDGVLKVRMPKREETKPRRIAVGEKN